MAVNTAMGGIQKPIEKSRGILWWAEAGTIDVESITSTVDLSTIGLTEAGGVTTDGVTFAANAEDPETYLDWNGNTFDSGEATSAPSIAFSVLEVLNANAAKLVFAGSAIKSTDGVVTSITGTGNPGNKLIVLDTRIKSKRVRVILPECSFASRGDDSYANDALYSWEVTYNILTGPDGFDIKRLFSDIV